MAQLVGVTGFEPATSSSRTKRATKLRHTPRCEERVPRELARVGTCSECRQGDAPRWLVPLLGGWCGINCRHRQRQIVYRTGDGRPQFARQSDSRRFNPPSNTSTKQCVHSLLVKLA